MQTKRAVARSLFHRADVLCSTGQEKQIEKSLVRKQLAQNGYSHSFLNRCEKERTQTTQNEKQWLSTITIPYMKDSSDAIRRILNSVDIRVAYKSSNTLASKFRSVKDPVDNCQKGDLIYKVSCTDCDRVYIGQTSRAVGIRMDEHSRMSKRVPNNAEARQREAINSGIASHVWDTQHEVDFRNPEIISSGWKNYHERLTAENYYIAKNPNNCNIIKSGLNPIWNSVLHRCS
jgi:hypothetical protein